MTVMFAALTLPVPPAPVPADAQSRTGKPAPMDEARFEMLYRRTAGSLWSYLFRLTGDAAVADDLLQKSFFRFLRANPTLASEEHTRRWIFRTATNLAFDHFRETKRERKRDESSWRSEAGPAMEPREVLRHDMMKTFSELKPRERALLWLAYAHGSSHSEIAGVLGLKTGSIKLLLFRARRKLAATLQPRVKTT